MGDGGTGGANVGYYRTFYYQGLTYAIAGWERNSEEVANQFKKIIGEKIDGAGNVIDITSSKDIDKHIIKLMEYFGGYQMGGSRDLKIELNEEYRITNVSFIYSGKPVNIIYSE